MTRNLPVNPNAPHGGEIASPHAPQTHPNQFANSHTWGCLSPIDIQPLDALLDDIRRTQAHILWLEAYIAQMPTDMPFRADEHFNLAEHERARVGKPTVVGSVKWQLQMQKQREQRSSNTRPATHPAITQLQSERRHLADVCYKATILGIKLDSIDYSRAQADLIIAAMSKFAIAHKLDPTSPAVADAITHALNDVLKEQEANQ